MQHNLPKVRGTYKFNVPLKNMSAFKTGGLCDVFFIPQDKNDLIFFLKNKPHDLKIICLGNMSNVLIPDSGIRGCVVYLKNTFDNFEFKENISHVEAGVSLSKYIRVCVDNGISCLEKLYCIPGTIGGALKMNAGIPEFEIADVLESITITDYFGNVKILHKKDLNMTYRNGNIPENSIILSCTLKINIENKTLLNEYINNIKKKRTISQPIGKATCGSTFKNPSGKKAWELIKQSGCDELSVGGAKISDLHCNFIINENNASSKNIIDLINLVKLKVLNETGILLEEEILIL